MTDVSRLYSARLGEIRDGQLQGALDRWGLGRLIAAEPAPFGLFGQNIFLSTSKGQYVLRGAQHGDWQFAKEVFFARLLAKGTDVPIPWPQWLETSPDLFGWPYIVMPRLTGLGLEDAAVASALSPRDEAQVARAMGRCLARLQTLTWDTAGDFNLATGGIRPFRGGHAAHLIGEVRRLAKEAQGSGALAAEDQAWIDGVLDRAAAVRGEGPTVYLHNDFSLNNCLVAPRAGDWTVTGVVDLMTSCFGAGEADLCRQAASYLQRDPALAETFIEAYQEAGGGSGGAQARMPLYVVYERLLIWTYFTRPEHRADWTAETTFARWARWYVERLTPLL